MQLAIETVAKMRLISLSEEEMKEVDEFDLSIIADFIGQSWSSFIGFCEERAEDGESEAQRLYEAIGGQE